VSLANPFPYDNVHLGRAGTLLVVELIGLVAMSMVLSWIGLESDLAVVAVWLVNLGVAWFLAQAARSLGRSALGYGLFSALAPVTAIYSWFHLHQLDAIARLERGSTTDLEAAPDRYVDPDGIVHERVDEPR
jgi:small multidrug resistance pump